MVKVTDSAVSVRGARPSDSAAIHKVHIAAMLALPKGAAGSPGVSDWIESRQPSHYENEMRSESVVVAERDDEIVGWGAFNPGKQEITNVFVTPTQQRNGVGTAVISTLERLARDAGFDSVQLQATGTAIGFYLARGYQSDPPVEAGAEWALMEKAL
jgi:GNAT superfamily N-acetyltransferase